MSLIDEIEAAQRAAGEAAVMRSLERQGLVNLVKPEEKVNPDTHFVQPKITGYRQLSKAEVDLMNEGKALAEKCGEYIAKLRAYSVEPNGAAPGASLDQRWISIGATDLQRGFMAVIRGIAQPTSF